MKGLLVTILLSVPSGMAKQPVVSSAPGTGVTAAGRGGPSGALHELPSNHEAGVETDRFIEFPGNAFTKVLNGGLMTRSMPRNGDPYHPGPLGNVLESRDDCAVATLEPYFETGSMVSDEIYFYYMRGGTARVRCRPGNEKLQCASGCGF